MPGYSSTEIITTIFYDILIAIACFFICRTHPKSVWYTPVICNALGIISAIFDPNFWTTSSTWIFWGGSFVLSIIGAIIGARIGRRIMNQA